MSLQKKVITDFEAVDRLREILYYEIRISIGSIFIFFLLARFGGIFIVIVLFTLAAVLLTPYIFYILIKEERYGWIAAYFLMIVIPVVSAFLIFRETIAFESILMLALLSFYIYCFLIKYAVDDWIRQYNWTQQLIQQKEDKIKRMEDELHW